MLGDIQPILHFKRTAKEIKFEITNSTTGVPKTGHYSAKVELLSASNLFTIFLMCPYHKEDVSYNHHIAITKTAMQLIEIVNVQPYHEFIFIFTHTLKNEGFTDHFFIPKLPDDGHIELETIINEMTKNGINFDRYRVDPFEGEDNPS